MKNDTITVVICYFGFLSNMFRTHTDDEKKFAPEMVKSIESNISKLLISVIFSLRRSFSCGMR